MTGLELLAVLYLVVGLGAAAVVFDGATGGWAATIERDRARGGAPDKEAELAAEMLRHARSSNPLGFGTILGLVALVVVLAWPGVTLWYAVDEVRRLWDRRPCRCDDCRAARRAKR